MALLGANKRNRISRLKNIALEKLQRSFTLPKRTSWSFRDSNMMMNNGELRYKQHVEVKKGHFSVLAIDEGGNAKRYVLPLCYLQNPSFLRLLEKASEEFGFEHEGALCIPCGWNELESILGLDRRY
ncbi:unnamed protein product [Rhodiola kirilowii]